MLSPPGIISELLRAVFSRVMTCEAGLLASQLARLVERLEVEEKEATGSELRDEKKGDYYCPLAIAPLVLRLHSQYPADVGCFAPYLLNCFSLQPGQALFIGNSHELRLFLAQNALRRKVPTSPTPTLPATVSTTASAHACTRRPLPSFT